MHLAMNCLYGLAGVASHALYFRKGEHHLRAPLYAALLILAFFSLTLGLIISSNYLQRQTFARLLVIGLWYLMGLYSSLLTYRLLLQPLRSFPGPLAAKASGLWFSYQVISKPKHRAFEEIQKLHAQYGPFVRIGPSNLVINHPDAIQALFGNKSRCVKGDWYDFSVKDVTSLHSVRSTAVHSSWRRLWSGAFGDEQIRNYEKRIVPIREKLVADLEATAVNGGSTDMTELFHRFNFDLTNDLAFGRSPNSLEDPSQRWTLKALQSGTAFLSFYFPAWVYVLFSSAPFLNMNTGWLRFIHLCRQKLQSRIEVIVAHSSTDLAATP
ncbi:hypothetical protein HIM_03524 [Hirsutella minnesotensis 3608]|uniref:Uncharacterized protein n=1 Tax=Hirsutella minnesotensis 3608 TaxID=1043627 RepID=A0A0F7ZVU1_9HYPO|nr:hypothetical protein HIM_03524 [Hirsutella minnesotensis 3608]